MRRRPVGHDKPGSERGERAKPMGRDEIPAAHESQVSSIRCGCGNLLARMVGGKIELKCKRCKRIIVVPLEP
ncbi:MAG TPA: hypothetical protein VIB79_18155 [Candidatus Binatia bacterium]